MLIRINVSCSIEDSAESSHKFFTWTPVAFKALVKRVGTTFQFIFAAPGEEIPHGERKSRGFTTLCQSVGPSPNGIHIVFVTKTTVVWCNFTKINQGQVIAIHDNVVTMKIIVGVSQPMEGVHSSHKLSKCVFLQVHTVLQCGSFVFNSSGSCSLHHVIRRITNTTHLNTRGQVPLSILLKLLPSRACFNSQILHVTAFSPPHCITPGLFGNFDGNRCSFTICGQEHASCRPCSHNKFIVVTSTKCWVPMAT
jgi:hypothetical protein